MQPRDFADNGETETAAGGARIARAIKTLEHMPAFGDRNSHAGIANLEPRASRGHATTQGHAAPAGCRGDGVVGEIAQRFLEHPGHAEHGGRSEFRTEVDAGGVGRTRDGFPRRS